MNASHKPETRTTVLVAICAILAGILLHNLYSWIPSALTALFSPVRESIWEHVKILFWPLLAAFLFLNRNHPQKTLPYALASLCIVCAAMLLIAGVVHLCLGIDSVPFDIALYLVLMILAFWLPEKLYIPYEWRNAPYWVTGIFAALIVLFTAWAPALGLFLEP